MSILTDDECREIYNAAMALPDRSIVAATRHIEAAVIAKLAQGVVMPKPAIETPAFSRDSSTQNYYTTDQLQTAIAAARVQENERCAKLVEHRMDENEPWMNGDDIRALLGKAST